jgi:uncharacterized OB-fold protein
VVAPLPELPVEAHGARSRVEFPEQVGLRLTTGIVGCEPDDVHVGMPVRVVFDNYEDVWLPFFEPVAS